ncbi:MAG: hypothetical protein Q9188_006111, partial [Gyalolechia gomerana]
MVSKLQLELRTKIMVCMIFLMGGVVLFTGVIRIILVYKPHSQYVSFTQCILWMQLHLATAIICACLPIYRPLVGAIVDSSKGLSKRYSRLLSRARRYNGSSASQLESPITDFPAKTDAPRHMEIQGFYVDNLQLLDTPDWNPRTHRYDEEDCGNRSETIGRA